MRLDGAEAYIALIEAQNSLTKQDVSAAEDILLELMDNLWKLMSDEEHKRANKYAERILGIKQ